MTMPTNTPQANLLQSGFGDDPVATIPTQSNNTTCYQAIQRIFRNAVVQLIRSRLTEAFDSQALAKLRAPFQKEWDDMVKAAEESRSRGVYQHR